MRPVRPTGKLVGVTALLVAMTGAVSDVVASSRDSIKVASGRTSGGGKYVLSVGRSEREGKLCFNLERTFKHKDDYGRKRYTVGDCGLGAGHGMELHFQGFFCQRRDAAVFGAVRPGTSRVQVVVAGALDGNFTHRGPATTLTARLFRLPRSTGYRGRGFLLISRSFLRPYGQAPPYTVVAYGRDGRVLATRQGAWVTGDLSALGELFLCPAPIPLPHHHGSRHQS